MKKWELAYYLIKSKKCIDSLCYIDDKIEIIKNLDLKEIIRNKESGFYLNLSFILDDCFPGKNNKRELCKNNMYVEKVYYERDKNIAHKDINYQYKFLFDLKKMIKKMREIIKEIFNLCKDFFPDKITLDFVSYDFNLFRFANNITFNVENSLRGERKYRFAKDKAKQLSNGSLFFVYDIDDKKILESKVDNDQIAIILRKGLNDFESLQEIQDLCIIFNYCFDKNIWIHPPQKQLKKIGETIKITGFEDYQLIVSSDCSMEFEKEIKSFLGGIDYDKNK